MLEKPQLTFWHCIDQKFKGKAPVVRFHGITSSTVQLVFRNHILLETEKGKFVDNPQQCFASSQNLRLLHDKVD